ncbi:unnamed protein product [Tenebrio molitor]|nr:unnamed protein product [Tenebrio molitor]
MDVVAINNNKNDSCHATGDGGVAHWVKLTNVCKHSVSE